MQIYVVIEYKGMVSEVLMAFEDLASAKEYVRDLQARHPCPLDIVMTALLTNKVMQDLN